MSRSRTSYRLRAAFVAGVLAPLAVSLCDAVVGLSLPGTSVSGIGEQGTYFFAILGPAVFTGLLFAVALSAIVALNALGAVRVRGVEAGYGVVLAALGLIVFLEWANLTLFSGGSMSSKWYRPIAEWILRLAIPVGVVLGVRVGMGGIAQAISGRLTLRHRLLGLVCLGGSAVLCFTNAKLYSNLYDFLHLQQVAIAIIAAAVGLFLLSAGSMFDGARSGWRSAVVAVLAACVFTGAIVTRDTDGYRRARSAALSRAKALPYHATWGLALLDKISPPAQLETIDVSDIVSGLRGATSEELRARLDQILPDRRKMNVLWLSVDTLRGDRCGFNGYGGGTTPRMDKLAAESFVFTRAQATYPTSNYSYSSILTSLYPRITPTYKAVRGLDNTYAPTTSLSGLLSKHGWHSVGVTAFNEETMAKRKWFGTFVDGFDVFNPDQLEESAKAAETNASALRAIQNRPEKKPYFLWAHYLEPHAPYLDQPGFERGGSPSELYDSEIAFCDAQVGEFLDALEASGHLKNTIIVFFSDHGEAFGEHGVQFHNSSVFQTQIHVPLFIRIPGISGRRIDQAVGLIDVLPTLVELLEVEDDQRRFGRSLLPMMFGTDQDMTGFSYSEVFGWMSGEHARDQRALIHGRHKIIYRPYQQTHEIYDLIADPGEQDSLVGKDDALEQRLYSMIQAVDKEIDGYFGNAVDPEDMRVEYLATLDKQFETIRRGELKDVQAAFRDLYKTLVSSYGNPMPSAQRWLGRDGIEAYFDRLATMRAEVPAATQYLIVRYMARWRNPKYIPFLKTVLPTVKGYGRAVIACALALAGDDTGRAELVEHGDQFCGIGLGYLGDPEGLEWLKANLREISRTTLCHALRCIGNYPELGGARLVRSRFTLPKISYQMRQALVEGLSKCDDPDATVLLVRLAQEKEADIREDAIKLLRKRMSAEDLAKNLDAMGAEIGADIATKNSVFLLAVSQYRRALEVGTLYNSHARLRLARIQAMAGRDAQARETLEEIAANSDVEADRAVARRRIAELGSPFPIDPKTFAFEVETGRVRLKSALAKGATVMLEVPVKNASEQHWSGGRWRKGISLHLRFEDADGKMVEGPDIPNFLPDEGISAGEERVLTLVGSVPRKAVKGGRLVIILKQEWLKLEDGGVVYRHPVPIDL